MGTSIQLITESLFREPLISNLVSNGYQIQSYQTQSDTLIFKENKIINVSIVQTHLWPREKHKLTDSTSIVMLGTPSWFYCWCEAMSNRVLGYVTPYDFQDTIITSLEWVLEGKYYISDAMKNLLSKKTKKRQEQFLNIKLSSHLTPSELEVLTLVGEGYTTSEIAKIRFRSVHTIKTQRKMVRRKLKINRGERLSVLAGRKVYTFKTLYLIEKNIEALDNICKNTP